MKNSVIPKRSTIKTAGYSSSVLRAVRGAKRAEAEERNEKWAALPREAKLAHLKTVPGNAARQFVRLGVKPVIVRTW